MSQQHTDELQASNDRGHGGCGCGAAKAAIGASGVTVTDPVCGMRVDPATSKRHSDHGGRTFHFCSAGCQAKFKAAPETYLKPKAPAPAKAGAIYTCPMHPQIRQQGPGSCPICGMALEPVEVTAEAAPNHELRRHDPALLDRPGPDPAGVRAGDGRPHSRARSARHRAARDVRPGSSSRFARRSSCGRAGRSSSAAGRRSSAAT